MTGKLIAVANMKGGVGKSTTVVSLAESLCAFDAAIRVLVIDLDPQASASMAIAGDDELGRMIDDGRSLENFLEKRLIEKKPAKISNYIHPAVCKTSHAGNQLQLAMLPCGPDLRIIERELLYKSARSNFSITASEGRIATVFRKEIAPLSEDYDYVIFDCAPGISPITEIAVCLSDLVIVPTVPDRISAYGLAAFWESIWLANDSDMRAKSLPHVLVVRMNQAIKQHGLVFNSLTKQAAQPNAGYRVLKSQIPTSAPLVDALVKDGYLTFSQKWTPDVVNRILNPLVLEIRSLCHGA